MKKLISTVLLFVSILAVLPHVQAKEGMWIPMLLGELNEKEMQEMGLKITAEDIYSVNHSSLKDAIVIFGRGCTGEVVSNEGLLLTNHHCGYGSIQSHSSVEHDYLQDGFWAMDKSEELPNPGLTATFLIRMEKVTDRVFDGVSDSMTLEEKEKKIQENIKVIKEKAIEGTHYEAVLKPFFGGNEYFLFINEVFTDVRLVGTPPSNIGKFGGDTDNWMWPRHTGDFSVFRIYAGKDNKPAPYSKDNVPYKPKRALDISLKGVEKGDFTFVFGYPGTTQEYLPSYAIKMITQVDDPVRIDLRGKRLANMDKYMSRDQAVRIQYSAKYARIANGWKKWQGEIRGIRKLDGLNKKKNYELAFRKWVAGSDELNAKYGQLLPDFKAKYDALSPLINLKNYIWEAGMSIEIVSYASKYRKLVSLVEEGASEEEINKEVDQLSKNVDKFFKDYYVPIDKDNMAMLLKEYAKNVDVAHQPALFEKINRKYDGNYKAFTNDVFDKSMFDNKERLKKMLNNFKKKNIKKIKKDPAYILASQFIDVYSSNVFSELKTLYTEIADIQKKYMTAQMEMEKDKVFYADANFTLRVAYGLVDDYAPKDGVFYKHYTTLDGIMEKENPDIFDYVVEDRLKELYNTKDYGKYAAKDGKIHVCFTASNHTTGGNSGSPVLNAEGQLIGLNFDRNWEGTMSDLMYDPDQCRNITLDIRYCLFIIDKFAGAGHLVEEMNIVE